MVKHRTLLEPESWLAHFVALRGKQGEFLLQKALHFYDAHTVTLRDKGLGICNILLELGLDNEGLAAALLYPALQSHDIHMDSILDQFGENQARLLRDVLQMRSLHKLQHLNARGGHQLENIRKMLLAMVADVRAVLIVLAERLWLLRQSKNIPFAEQQKLARETLDIYAPLANRLGVGQLKWEMEDLCLRYLQPDSYQKIARWLASRREEREQYIQQVLHLLTTLLQQHQIADFQVTGRVKHIYSIYRKMQRKKGDLNEIYDISAVRVLVPTIEACYTVLGLVHETWQPIQKEFDDYIAHPKPNGYRSIHTAVIGPEGRTVEVQIRTLQMHQESELGVAAHWRYKEGGAQKSDYEAKIAWLRQVMAWQREVAQADGTVTTDQPVQDLFADRVYVFTPGGDIIDLPKGATPLDFAYHIHSEVGHRCRGAKIDGAIVPLTYALQMGQRVEILTAREARPSRDWLSPHAGYLKTPRARAKVQHWFKARDHEQYLFAGRELLEKESRRLNFHGHYEWPLIVQKLNYKTEEDVLAALGAGDIRPAQIIHLMQANTVSAEQKVENPPLPKTVEKKPASAQGIFIQGASGLLTQIARCCKPLPGDDVIGFITRGRGISIHRRDCQNVAQLDENQQQRLVEVNWAQKQVDTYPVDLWVQGYDRSGLVRDITHLLAAEKIDILSVNTKLTKNSHEVDIQLSITLPAVSQLEKIVDRLRKIPQVTEVQRR